MCEPSQSPGRVRELRCIALAACALAACTSQTAAVHQVTAYLDAWTLTRPFTAEMIRVSLGSSFRIHTSWAASCSSRSSPYLSMDPVEYTSSDCDEVRHRVRIRCAEPCRIRLPDGSVETDTAVWGPTRFGADISIEPKRDTLHVEVVFEGNGEKHVERLPPLAFVSVGELVLECAPDGETYQACAGELVATPKMRVRVREPSGVRLGPLRINGVLKTHFPSSEVTAALVDIAPGAVDGRGTSVVPGDYPFVVEIQPAPHTIRSETTLHLVRAVP
jgi:hypothetical protein